MRFMIKILFIAVTMSFSISYGIDIELQDASKQLEQHHPLLKAARLELNIAKYKVITLTNRYIPLLSGNFDLTGSKRPESTTPSFLSDYEDDNLVLVNQLKNTYSLTLSKDFIWGTTGSVNTSITKIDTDLDTYKDHNPRYQGGLFVKLEQSLLKGRDSTINAIPIKKAEQDVKIAKYKIQKTYNKLNYELAKNFWELYQLNQDLTVWEANKKLAAFTKEKNLKFWKAGKKPYYEVLQSQAYLDKTIATLGKMRFSKMNLEEKILDRTMLQKEYTLKLTKNYNYINSVEPITLNHKAILNPIAPSQKFETEKNPEIQILEVEVEKAKLDLDSSKDNLLPDLRFSISYGSIAAATDSLRASRDIFKSKYPRIEAVLSLNMMLGGDKNNARKRGKALKIAQKKAQLEQKKSALYEEFLATRKEIKKLERNYSSLNRQMELEKEILNTKKQLYSSGLISTNELLEAQKSYSKLQTNRNNSFAKKNLENIKLGDILGAYKIDTDR